MFQLISNNRFSVAGKKSGKFFLAVFRFPSHRIFPSAQPAKKTMDFLNTPSKLGAHGVDIVVNKKYQVKDQNEQGRHSDVFFVETPERGTNLAVKKQFIKSPFNHKDRAYRELRIFQAIQTLGSPNFVSIVDWYKVKSDGKFESAEDQYMHYVLEYAGTTLAQLKTLDAEDMKSILFQLFHSINLAQEELEFNHNDLHLKNILLNKVEPGKELTYSFGSELYKPARWLVKICDFGLSRITTPEDGEVIYNHANSFSEMFSSQSDIIKLAQELNKFKSAQWEEEDRKLYLSLKKAMSKGTPLQDLLSHPFFDSLIVESMSVPKNEKDPKPTENSIPNLIEQMEFMTIKPKVEITLESKENQDPNGRNEKPTEKIVSLSSRRRKS